MIPGTGAGGRALPVRRGQEPAGGGDRQTFAVAGDVGKGSPVHFLDHALKCGDSLVGASEDDFLRWAHGWKAAEATLFDEQLQLQIETARQKRRRTGRLCGARCAGCGP